MSEFSHIIALRDLEKGPFRLSLEADAEARDALAKRFGLLSLDCLKGDIDVTATSDGGRVEGTLVARMTQRCVVSLDPIDQQVSESFVVRFTRDPLPVEDEETIIDPEEEDVELLEGDEIDVGEVLAQTLSLAIDPYPRKSDVGKSDKILTEEEAKEEKKRSGPFSVLKKLHDKS